MPSLTLEYGRPKLDGGRAVYVRLSINSTSKRLMLPYCLEKNEYRQYPDGRIKVTNESKYFAIQDIYNDYNSRMIDFLKDDPLTRIKADRLLTYIVRKNPAQVKSTDFFQWARKWCSTCGLSSVSNYYCMLRGLERFTGRTTLMFGEIDYAFLKRYLMWLNGRPRAASMYLGQMRHLWNEACLEFNSDTEIVLSPILFQRFKVPKQKPVGQRALEIDELRRIFDYEPFIKRAILAYDVSMLSFCLMGTNSVDLFKAKTYRNGCLCYERAKTRERRSDNAYIEIEVPEMIMPLMDKYGGGKNGYVFRFADMYSSPSDFNKAINIGLKHIGDVVGIEQLQFYQFRHTWATIARNELNIDAATVDEALNHKNQHYQMLDIYVKKDFRRINEANRKVVDFVFHK